MIFRKKNKLNLRQTEEMKQRLEWKSMKQKTENHEYK